jgi:hypothetical protein
MAQQLIPLVLVVLLAGSQGGPTNIYPRGKDLTPNTGVGPGGSVGTLYQLPTNNRESGGAFVPVSLQTRTLEDILTDQALWGEKFSSVLAALPAFRRAGEKQVWVFPDRILGSNKYRNRDEAEGQARKLADTLNATQKLTPRSPKIRVFMAKGAEPLKPEAILFPEDRSARIAAVGSQFLAPRLTIADVRKRLGPPQRVTTELLDDGTERRPVILKLYHYAGGAIIFVESDWNPNIGAVDRVFLDPSKISATLFEEEK